MINVRKNQAQIIKEALSRKNLSKYNSNVKKSNNRPLNAEKKKEIVHITKERAGKDDLYGFSRFDCKTPLDIADSFFNGPLMEKFGNGYIPCYDAVDDKSTVENIHSNDEKISLNINKTKGQQRTDDRDKNRYNGFIGDYGRLNSTSPDVEWISDDEKHDGNGFLSHVSYNNSSDDNSGEWNFDSIVSKISKRKNNEQFNEASDDEGR